MRFPGVDKWLYLLAVSKRDCRYYCSCHRGPWRCYLCSCRIGRTSDGTLLGFPKLGTPGGMLGCWYSRAFTVLFHLEQLDQPPKKISKIIVIMLAAITGIFRYATAWRSPTICDFTGSPEAATKSSNPCFDKKRCLLRIMTEFRPKSPTFHSRGVNKEEMSKKGTKQGRLARDSQGTHLEQIP